MEIKIVDEQGKVETDKGQPVEVKDPEVVVAEPVNLEMLSLAQMFDFDPSETKTNEDKLDILLKWAKTQVEKPTMENIKWAIRSLEGRVGAPPLGEKRINKLHRFAFLELEEQKIRAEKESLYVN